MFKSPKTTWTGISLILTALAAVATALANGNLDTSTIMAAVAALIGGIQGIVARDNSVTSEKAGAK